MKTWFRTLASLVVACSLLLSAQQVLAETSSVGDPGESWSIPNDADRGLHVQQFIDSFPGESVSYLVDEALRQNKMVDPTCKSVSDERCTSPRLTFSSILPMCGTISSRYCVEEFGVANADGTKSLATFNRYFPNKALNEFAADPSLRLPFGGTGSLLNLPEAAHAGGNLYYLSVLTEGSVDKANGAYLGKFSIRLNPVALKVGDGAIQGIDSGWSKETGGSGHAVGEWRQAGFGFSGTSFCVAGSATENLCAQRYAFPAGKKFYLKVRLQSEPGGWMHGRIYQPEISITQSQNYSTLEVAAFPVAVPAVYKVYQYSVMPQALKDQYDVRTGDYKPEVAKLSEADIQNRVKGGCGRTACTEDPLTRNKIVALALLIRSVWNSSNSGCPLWKIKQPRYSGRGPCALLMAMNLVVPHSVSRTAKKELLELSLPMRLNIAVVLRFSTKKIKCSNTKWQLHIMCQRRRKSSLELMTC